MKWDELLPLKTFSETRVLFPLLPEKGDLFLLLLYTLKLAESLTTAQTIAEKNDSVVLFRGST